MPSRNPPTCAHHATPPEAAAPVVPSEPMPLTNCITNHKPMNTIAGTRARNQMINNVTNEEICDLGKKTM